MEEEADDGEKLKEVLSAWQHFLVDTEMKSGIFMVINFQMSKLDTKLINEKLEKSSISCIPPQKSITLFDGS